MRILNTADRESLLEPVFKMVEITPSDTNVNPHPLCRGFHADSDGTVAFVDIDGASHTRTVKEGMYYPYGFRYIKSTGTTVTSIAGFLHNSEVKDTTR